MTQQPKTNLFVLFFASIFPFFAALSYFVLWPGLNTTPWLYSISKIAQFTFPLFLFFFRKQDFKLLWRRSSIPSDHKLTNLFASLISGLLLCCAGSLFYFLFLKTSFDLSGVKQAILAKLTELKVTTSARYFYLSIFISVIHSFLEEYYWRGFLLSEIKTRFQEKTSLFLASLAFTLHHIVVIANYVRFESRIFYVALGSFIVFFIGLFWAIQYSKTQRLFVPWISHFFADLLIMGVGYDIIFR